MIIRAILPAWAADSDPTKRRVLEGDFDETKISEINAQFYNVYFLPNYPSTYNTGVTVDGTHIDTFTTVFADMDLKDGTYPDAEAFMQRLGEFALTPSKVVKSGNGVHAYWKVADLDAMSFLKLNRRICRHFKTDEAVSKIYQLMRLPGTINTKDPDNFKECELVYDEDFVYTCEELDAALPMITQEDEQYCTEHYNKTYEITSQIEVDDRLPPKFGQLLQTSQKAKDIFTGNVEDRSKADFHLGHLMLANGFTRDEAMSVLVNTPKALARAPKHRVNYAINIVEKLWTFEAEKAPDTGLSLSSSVRDILQRTVNTSAGTRFPCYRYIDNTAYGFRLGQVIGLVAGSGVGKTAVALNMFMGFVEENPDFEHMFIPLEQPSQEIAERWKAMCGDRDYLYDKVHIVDNYHETEGFRHLSLAEIQAYILKFQKTTGKKIGCVVIDHIGALKKKDKNGERLDLEQICQEMKTFAVQTNTMLVMQSQTSREKAGIGDLELNKDAAYGTVYFESFCDYLITIWQPLKRTYTLPDCPTVTAFKFCKIRHKKQSEDVIKEDVAYTLVFDPNTERLREMTQDEETAFNFFNKRATNMRKQDRKTDLVTYTSAKADKSVDQTRIVS